MRSQIKQITYALLGMDRIVHFARSFQQASVATSGQPIEVVRILVAILIGIVPLLPGMFHFSTVELDFPTIMTGVATCLAVVYRRRLGIELTQTQGWRQALSLTHTGFALGCIPAVLVIALCSSPVRSVVAHAVSHGGPAPSLISIVLSVVLIALWAGVTEEFIFRGLVLSAVRRATFLGSPQVRTWVAVALSSTLFGLSHFGTWGPTITIAIIGVGMGFGAAYVAIGERLAPLIVYHVLFDILSLSVAVLSNTQR